MEAPMHYDLDFEIPVKILREIKELGHIRVKFPWEVGIPVIDSLLEAFQRDPGKLQALKDAGLELMLVPRVRR